MTNVSDVPERIKQIQNAAHLVEKLEQNLAAANESVLACRKAGVEIKCTLAHERYAIQILIPGIGAVQAKVAPAEELEVKKMQEDLTVKGTTK